MARTRNSKIITASPENIYKAFTDPKALEKWLVPGEMTGKIHSFDLRQGGGYEMSLFYPDSDATSSGKSGNKEDRYVARFIDLVPGEKISMSITFDSDDPEFAGEMLEHVTLQPRGQDTEVIIEFENIPKGVKPSDNEEGTESSLNKLADYLKDQKVS